MMTVEQLLTSTGRVIPLAHSFRNHNMLGEPLYSSCLYSGKAIYTIHTTSVISNERNHAYTTTLLLSFPKERILYFSSSDLSDRIDAFPLKRILRRRNLHTNPASSISNQALFR